MLDKVMLYFRRASMGTTVLSTYMLSELLMLNLIVYKFSTSRVIYFYF